VENIQIARICHQANKAYCESLGDRSQVDWEVAPEWQRQSAMTGVLFRVMNPHVGGYASCHDNWKKDKLDAGWVYGATKDTKLKTHPCIVDWNDLPPEQQFKDRLFCAIVDALYDRDIDFDLASVGQ
jgi:RyR domain